MISHSIEKTYSEEYPFYFLISVSFAILFYEFKFVILSTYISYKFQKIYLFMKNLTFPPILLVPLVPPLAQACSLCPIQNSKFSLHRTTAHCPPLFWRGGTGVRTPLAQAWSLCPIQNSKFTIPPIQNY